MITNKNPVDQYKNGTKVKIMINPANIADDWSQEALSSRKNGATGVIIHFHDTHGLTYEVRHDGSGDVGHYEHHELKPL